MQKIKVIHLFKIKNQDPVMPDVVLVIYFEQFYDITAMCFLLILNKSLSVGFAHNVSCCSF